MDNPIPEVFVLWHPRCGLGEFLARRIHRWLRPGNGVGPQVFFRCTPSPESPKGGLPRPLPGEIRSEPVTVDPVDKASAVSNLQIVLPLIDEQMIADPGWRFWLTQLASTPAGSEDRVMAPVALDSTAYNVPAPLNELNFLRPAGLPLPAGQEAAEVAKDLVARSLLKQLTETLCRLLLGRGRSAAAGGAPPKVKIFLSHAKADGTTPAKRLRDYIYSQTQLEAFYDENDIPFGSVFERVLHGDLDADQSAALVAVRSAHYASRPWCRRELSLFRRPLPAVRQPRVAGEAERWRLNPMLVVEAIAGGQQSAGIPELGNTPLIRWADHLKDHEEQIVTTVLRDVLLSAYHLALGQKVAEATEGDDRIILNWLPDPPTLLHIPRVRAQEKLKAFYPGRGLSGMELDTLSDWFPNVEWLDFEGVIS